jgi:Glu-tRNA(Gln) amidotransferase subunit E-like FAD-binding protein
MRVFISSTVYDLIDVRAELAEQLRTLGITPVLSDDKLSGFSIQQHDINSIETCLVNVDSCDEVVLILDKRYGPTLKKLAMRKFQRHILNTAVPLKREYLFGFMCVTIL